MGKAQADQTFLLAPVSKIALNFCPNPGAEGGGINPAETLNHGGRLEGRQEGSSTCSRSLYPTILHGN